MSPAARSASFTAPIAEVDPEIAEVLEKERARQESTLEMIASENFVPFSVLEAQGSVLTNKYAEGYPGRRYYGGCEFVDIAENLAIERAKELFGAAYANVQPHSGATANAAVLHAIAAPGDTILGLELAHGGHLTHGMKINFSGKVYQAAAYGVDKDSFLIDMDHVRDQAKAHKPKVLIAGWSAYPRHLDFAAFREIADEVGAMLWVDMAHFAGLVAAGLHPSPVPYADVISTTVHKTLGGPRSGLILSRHEELGKKLNSAVFPGQQGGPLMHVIAAKAVAYGEALTDEFFHYQLQVKKNAAAMAKAFVDRGYDIISGGTDNHLMLIDLRNKGVTGKATEQALVRAHITANKNMVPFDDKSPFTTSGIRLGAPAITTRGLKEGDMDTIADLIDRVVMNIDSDAHIKAVGEEVVKMMQDRPLFTWE